MIQYKICFSNSDIITIDEEQFKKFKLAVSNAIKTTNSLVFIVIDDSLPLIQLNAVIAVIAEEINDPQTKGVITPPSPSELREETQRQEQSQDVSLDAQLSGNLEPKV